MAPPDITADIRVLLRCLTCGGRFGPEYECLSCGACVEVRGGVPVFLPRDLETGTARVRESYSSRWAHVPKMYDDHTFANQLQRAWYLSRYHWQTEQRLQSFLQTKSAILDVGCGLGKDLRWYAMLQPRSNIVGVDLSDGVFRAAELSRSYANVGVLQGDLNGLPFDPETFDLIVCDQVLTTVESPPASLRKLWTLLRHGGHFAFNVYRRKAPIREFADDFLRSKISAMSPEKAWDASTAITRLGRALSGLKATIDVGDIPEIDVKAGSYDVQRFIYYHVLKCFWNDGLSFDENNAVNMDWYHTAFSNRHTTEEVERWAAEVGMTIDMLDHEDPSTISVLARKA